MVMKVSWHVQHRACAPCDVISCWQRMHYPPQRDCIDESLPGGWRSPQPPVGSTVRQFNLVCNSTSQRGLRYWRGRSLQQSREILFATPVKKDHAFPPSPEGGIRLLVRWSHQHSNAANSFSINNLNLGRGGDSSQVQNDLDGIRGNGV